MIAKGNSPQTKCKYIHVMRHPKDVCVSLYHHMKAFTDYEYNGKFPEFIDLFLNGLGNPFTNMIISISRVSTQNEDARNIHMHDLGNQIRGIHSRYY